MYGNTCITIFFHNVKNFNVLMPGTAVISPLVKEQDKVVKN